MGPDSESRRWVEAIADRAGFGAAVCTKTRLGDQSVTIVLPDVDLSGRQVVLVDDVASTGATLARTAEQCRERGATRVDVMVTHGLFVGDAIPALKRAGVSEVWSTDSVAHSTNVIPLAKLLAEGLLARSRSPAHGA